MPYYCYLCNEPMAHTVYVCNEHARDSRTRELYHYVLGGGECDAMRLGPRNSPDAPFGNIRDRRLHWDLDYAMDKGL